MAQSGVDFRFRFEADGYVTDWDRFWKELDRYREEQRALHELEAIERELHPGG